MRKAPSQLAFATPHLHQHDDYDEDNEDEDEDDEDEDDDEHDDEDDDAHHLAQPGEVPAHHDLGGVRKERQDIRPALCVLQGNLENWSVFVATDLTTIVT